MVVSLGEQTKDCGRLLPSAPPKLSAIHYSPADAAGGGDGADRGGGGGGGGRGGGVDGKERKKKTGGKGARERRENKIMKCHRKQGGRNR